MGTSNRLLRDPGIELARIVGCLIVISCHVKMNYSGVQWNPNRLYIAMLSADGVAIFWIITGAFIFSNNSYFLKIKHTVKKIILPTVLVGIFYFYLYPVVADALPIAQAIRKPKTDYIAIFNSLLIMENGIYGFSLL